MLRVVLADDENKVILLMQKLIDWEALGYEIAGTANDGLRALELVREKQPHLLITDVRMPGCDGIELIQRAKALQPKLHFIVISGYRKFEYAQNALKYGVEDYLLKPLKQEELTGILLRLKEKMGQEAALEFQLKRSGEHQQELLLDALLGTAERGTSFLSAGQANGEYGFHFGSGTYAAAVIRVDVPDAESYQDGYRILLRHALEIVRRESGLLTDYHLRYLRYDGALSIRIAFTDSTLEQSALRAMAGNLLLIALAALVVLLGCSYLLSGVAARPVERAWQEQQRFLSDASHELKTPLTVILSSADLLAESAPAEEQTYVENIRAESRRMKKLVEEMLTLFRAESVRRETAFSEVDLSDVVTDAALRFEPVVFESGRRLLYTIDEGLQVSGDRDALERLTGILLDNAVKYAPQGTDIRLTLTRQDRTACLAVENGGDPIPPEVAAHLFDRFYRADSSRTGTGFGLGLAIARAIVQNHRGNIICRSQEGLNRFSVTLPILRQKGAQ